MDEIAQSLLATLKKSSVAADAKLNQFNTLKSSIKHQRVPESALVPTLECIRLGISSQTTSSLVISGFSTLSHLVKRLTLQDQLTSLLTPRSHLIPTLLDRLGDTKESYRNASFQAFCDLWPARPADIERAVREGAIQGNNARAKEMGMQWVTKMHVDHDLQFRSFVAPLVDCLDHADGSVRDAAKHNLVALFRTASDRAKADLKRQLVAHNVRKSIAAYILSQLQIPMPTELGSTTTAPHRVNTDAPSQAEVRLAETKTAADPVNAPALETSHNIDPLFVESARELEHIFQSMQGCFEGRESEHNWMLRDGSVLKLRRYLKGNAPSEYPSVFVGGIKTLLDGILKVVNSLRTTMSTNGCHLVQELARALGSGMDPFVELLMQNLVKMCSATKQIAAQNANTTLDTLFSHVSYNLRLMQHVWGAAQDKNIQPRIFVSSWLKTIMRRQSQNRSQFEHTGGIDLAEKTIQKCLTDANPKVRENMRGTFWTFTGIWPKRGETIMHALDPKSKQLLEKDPANPNAAHSEFTASVGPHNINPRLAASTSRTNLKETIAAQKKAALAAKRIPDRPNSAMATLSPAKTPAGGTSTRSQFVPARSHLGNDQLSASRPRGNNSAAGQGSLMSGPVRRPKRVETARPATADPYASHRNVAAETPPTQSPVQSPFKDMARPATISTKRGNHIKHNSTSTVRMGRAPDTMSSQNNSPLASPVKDRLDAVETGDDWGSKDHSRLALEGTHSPTDEDIFTVVEPSITTASAQTNENEVPSMSDSASPVAEDNFTLVMPSKLVSLDTGDGPVSASTTSHQSLQNVNELHAPDSLGNENSIEKEDSSETVRVYEDPASSTKTGLQVPSEEKPVLEELPINEQSQPAPGRLQPKNDEHFSNKSHDHLRSPIKRGSSTDPGAETASARAEGIKNKRLLSGGIERLRAKTLDAHGFRRLQDLVKSTSRELEISLAPLLHALVEYLEAPSAVLKTPEPKATSLKSQALGIIREVATLHRRDPEILDEFPLALTTVLRASIAIGDSAHGMSDLERTAFDIVSAANDRNSQCMSAALDVAAMHDDSHINMNGAAYRRLITLTLAVLARLLGPAQGRPEALDVDERKKLGATAVRFLDDLDPDVRRADTEFCVALYGIFGSENSETFWNLLKGAHEPQLNLIAYYLARRGQATK